MIDQGENDPRLKGLATPEGIKVEIVAEMADSVHPVGMTFDADGSLYVLDWVPVTAAKLRQSSLTIHYKDGARRQVTVLKKPVKDLVKVLRDVKGKGLYEQTRVVLQEELPSSILLHDGWMYLTGQAAVRRYQMADIAKWDAPQTPLPTDGELPADAPKPEVIVQGFGAASPKPCSGLSVSNDGWLYITTAAGDHFGQGSDGSRATVLRTGAVFRCRPDGSKLEDYALGFRNGHGDPAFDSAGNLFLVDTDAEGNGRLLHVVQGSDFGWRVGGRPASGERPGTLPPLLKTGRGVPGSVLIYNDTRFPEHYRGLLLWPDGQLIHACRVTPKGATFEVVQHFELLKSKALDLRPCQVLVGPDGAIYVCDRATRGGSKHGRIYRLSWAGTREQPVLPLRGMASWAKIIKQSDEELLQSFACPDGSDRQRARAELVRRVAQRRANAKTIVPALLKLVKNGEATFAARITALGALQALWNGEVAESFVELLQDPNPELRRLAAEGLALCSPAGDKEVHEALVRAMSDEDPAVRRAILLAIGRIAAPGAADVLVSAFQFDDGKDAYLHDGIVRAIERVGKPAVDKLLALADSGVARDWDRVVTAFLACRSRPAALALPTLLENVHLMSAQKADLLRSYSNYLLDPPISLEPVAEYLGKLPRAPKGVKVSEKEAAELAALVPVKLAGLEVLAAGGAAPGLQAQAALLTLLEETDPPVRIGAARAIAATRLVRARPRLVKLLEGSLSPAERAAIVEALDVLKDGPSAPRPGTS
jgi:HEAT repeat protein